mgnify:CR=1 FL=1
MRWLIVFLLAFLVFQGLAGWLRRIGLGRLPGDFSFRWRGRDYATLSLGEQMRVQLARDAVNAWIFAPQVGTVVRKGLRGTWMNYPIFVHDIAAMWWE